MLIMFVACRQYPIFRMLGWSCLKMLILFMRKCLEKREHIQTGPRLTYQVGWSSGQSVILWGSGDSVVVDSEFYSRYSKLSSAKRVLGLGPAPWRIPVKFKLKQQIHHTTTLESPSPAVLPLKFGHKPRTTWTLARKHCKPRRKSTGQHFLFYFDLNCKTTF